MSNNENKYKMIYIKKRASARSNTLRKNIKKKYSPNELCKTAKRKYIDFQDNKKIFNLRNTCYPINNILTNNFINTPIRTQNLSSNKLDISTDKKRQYDDGIFNSKKDKVLTDEDNCDSYSNNYRNTYDYTLNSPLHYEDLLNGIKNKNEEIKNLKEKINKLEEKNELKNEEIDELTLHYKNKFLEGEKERNKINENNEKIQKDLENKEKEFGKINEENITLKNIMKEKEKNLQNLIEKNKEKDVEINKIKNKIKEIEVKEKEEKEENKKLKENILKATNNLDKEIQNKNKIKKENEALIQNKKKIENKLKEKEKEINEFKIQIQKKNEEIILEQQKLKKEIEETKKIKEENKKIKEEKKNFEQKCLLYKKENQKMKEENLKNRQEKELNKQEYEKNKYESGILKKEIEKIKEENEKVKKENEKIKEEMRIVKRENEIIKQEKENNAKTIEIVKQKNIDLNKKIKDLEKEIKIKREEYNLILDYINKIFENNEPLKLLSKPALIGLNNIGSSSYINPVLQCFSQTKFLTNYFLKKNFKDKKNNSEIKNDNSIHLNQLYFELIEKLWNINGLKSISPNNFKNNIEKMNPIFRNNQNGNFKDFIIFFLTQMHKELAKPNIPNNINSNLIYRQYPFNQYNKNIILENFFNGFNQECSIISDYFFGFTETSIECLNCRNNYNFNYGIFNCIIFKLEEVNNRKKMYNLQYNNLNNHISLNDYFFYKKEILCQNQTYQNFCQICNRLCDSKFSSKIFLSPNILIIIIEREKYSKTPIKLDFTETIDITEFVLQKEVSKLIYNLYAVITSINYRNFNNLVASCKNPIDNKWYRYDDEKVYPINNLEKEVIEFGTPQALFYEKINLK